MKHDKVSHRHDQIKKKAISIIIICIFSTSDMAPNLSFARRRNYGRRVCQTESLIAKKFLHIKDISISIPCNHWYENSFSFDGIQVGLRKKPNAFGIGVFGEDNCISSKSHGSRFKSIAVMTYWHMLSLFSHLTNRRKRVRLQSRRFPK